MCNTGESVITVIEINYRSILKGHERRHSSMSSNYGKHGVNRGKHGISDIVLLGLSACVPDRNLSRRHAPSKCHGTHPHGMLMRVSTDCIKGPPKRMVMLLFGNFKSRVEGAGKHLKVNSTGPAMGMMMTV